jgi:hypothetical protein
MARRTNEARSPGQARPDVVGGLRHAGDVMLPGARARIAPTTFDEWLATGAR